jgi:tryptophan synthase alpha subunit
MEYQKVRTQPVWSIHISPEIRKEVTDSPVIRLLGVNKGLEAVLTTYLETVKKAASFSVAVPDLMNAYSQKIEEVCNH